MQRLIDEAEAGKRFREEIARTRGRGPPQGTHSKVLCSKRFPSDRVRTRKLYVPSGFHPTPFRVMGPTDMSPNPATVCTKVVQSDGANVLDF